MLSGCSLVSSGLLHSLRSSILYLALLLLAVISSLASGQVVDDLCICSPTTFTFTLDFAGACPGTVEEGPGISSVNCFDISNSTDLVPVSVSTIQVLELDQGLQNLNGQRYDGPFEEGDSVTFTSVATGVITEKSEVPGGLQVNTIGTNAEGVPVLYSFIVDYSNSCSDTPIFQIGDQIGWIIISDITPARPEYCLAATLAPITDAPVTPAPVVMPTVAPATPVVMPTVAPVVPPTELPVVFPTDAPVVEPTDSPEMTPTSKTTPSPVSKPIYAPIEEPAYPTYDYSMSYDYNKGKKGKGGGKKGGGGGKKGGDDDDDYGYDDDDDDGGYGKGKGGKKEKKNEKEGSLEKEGKKGKKDRTGKDFDYDYDYVRRWLQ